MASGINKSDSLKRVERIHSVDLSQQNNEITARILQLTCHQAMEKSEQDIPRVQQDSTFD